MDIYQFYSTKRGGVEVGVQGKKDFVINKRPAAKPNTNLT